MFFSGLLTSWSSQPTSGDGILRPVTSGDGWRFGLLASTLDAGAGLFLRGRPFIPRFGQVWARFRPLQAGHGSLDTATGWPGNAAPMEVTVGIGMGTSQAPTGLKLGCNSPASGLYPPAEAITLWNMVIWLSNLGATRERLDPSANHLD